MIKNSWLVTSLFLDILPALWINSVDSQSGVDSPSWNLDNQMMIPENTLRPHCIGCKRRCNLKRLLFQCLIKSFPYFHYQSCTYVYRCTSRTIPLLLNVFPLDLILTMTMHDKWIPCKWNLCYYIFRRNLVYATWILKIYIKNSVAFALVMITSFAQIREHVALLCLPFYYRIELLSEWVSMSASLETWTVILAILALCTQLPSAENTWWLLHISVVSLIWTWPVAMQVSWNLCSTTKKYVRLEVEWKARQRQTTELG